MTSTVRYPVVELRQYTLRPGQREVLIDLFDREFVESQEAEGMAVVGQFRDLDDPDRFVWIRGFGSMPARARALAGFYGGPVWKANSAAANATMIDSDNVLLLRRVNPGATGDKARDIDPVALLRSVGLGQFLNSLPKQLSGGMQQRVAHVRAFALGAPILLMDEPFASLDEITRASMRMGAQMMASLMCDLRLRSGRGHSRGRPAGTGGS